MPTKNRRTQMKIFNVYVDVVESYTVPVKANSKEEALEKAKNVEPSDYNVPHYSENIVKGVDNVIEEITDEKTGVTHEFVMEDNEKI